jgi:Family of unknown function (DUF6338)
MPANAIAALIYPFFLIPGLIFLNRTETHLPRRKRSVFRETATVVFASVGSAAVVLLLYVAASFILAVTLPLDSLVKFTADPAGVFTSRPRASIAGMLAFLVLSSAVAWLGASKWVYEQGRRILWAGSGIDVHGTTAWQEVLLPSADKQEVVVGVQLKSGIWVQGVHDAHSDVEEENGDRQLILRSPLRQRLKDHGKTEELKDFDRLVIQASEIDYLASFERDETA